MVQLECQGVSRRRRMFCDDMDGEEWGDEKTHHDCDVVLGLVWGRGKGRKGRGKFKQQRTVY